MSPQNDKLAFAKNLTGDVTAIAVALDERDRATHEHCHRVAALALNLGAVCGLSEAELQMLGVVAGFHDIGKIGIPDRVLKKLTRFTDDDWAIMKEHSARGERIILAANLESGEAIAKAVRHHHERHDGTGYPDGLRGEQIPIMARIVGIVDTYDAMARMRLYSGPRPHRKIMDELRRVAGGQHDPYMTGKFEAIIEHSPFRAS
jgi:HD-GYP domain-containing protein (c-di-GMP phosphodiesterase class II)